MAKFKFQAFVVTQWRLLRRSEIWRLDSLVGCCFVLVLVVGCGSDATVRHGDIRNYTAPREVTLSAESFTKQKTAPTTARRPRVVYTLPDGWNEKAGASGMRLATLLIGDPADENEVTIIPAAGSLRSNLERWQNQLDEDSSIEAQSKAVDKALAEAGTVMVQGRQAKIVLLVAEGDNDADGTPQAILGGIIPQEDNKAIFIKFRGNVTVARRERANFMKFVASLQFP